MIKLLLATGIQTFNMISQVMSASSKSNFFNNVKHTNARGYAADFILNTRVSLECILKMSNLKYNVASGVAFLQERPIYLYMTESYLPMFKEDQYPKYDVSKRHFYEYRSYFNPLMLIMAEIEYANEYKPSIKEAEHLENYVLDLKNILALFSSGNPKDYWNWFSYELEIHSAQTVDDAFSYIYLPPQCMLSTGEKISDYDRVMTDEHAVRWALKTGAPISELPKFLMVNMEYLIKYEFLPQVLACRGNYELFFGLKEPVYRIECVFYHGTFKTYERANDFGLMFAGKYEFAIEEYVDKKAGDGSKKRRGTTTEKIVMEERYGDNDNLAAAKKNRKIIAILYRKLR